MYIVSGNLNKYSFTKKEENCRTRSTKYFVVMHPDGSSMYRYRYVC